MKSVLFTLCILISGFTIQAQELSGYWLGTLHVQGQKMRIAFNISKDKETFKTTMDSPDQKAKGIPTTTASMVSDNIHITIPQMGVSFKGILTTNTHISGTFSQGGLTLPLELKKQNADVKQNQRPQHPTKPYSYLTENVKIKNTKANILLAGTLTKPKQGDQFPAIILISGSGPQNRDEEILEHKPFLVIADYFTKLGYAVLRYDDRGTYESEGDFKLATSLDFAEDVDAIIDYLKTRKDINPSKIGLMGHSEGGVIAPMVASTRNDLSFIVLLAGTGVTGREVILDQIEAINRANGETEENISLAHYTSKVTFDFLETIQNKTNKKELLTAFLTDQIDNNSKFSIPTGITKAQFIETQVPQLSSAWMNFFLFYNPQHALSKVSCPVLALNGEKDLQVTHRLNLPEIENALKTGQTTSYKTVSIANLNHLFQECTTGSPNEYGEIKQTFSPDALHLISNWMKTLNL